MTWRESRASSAETCSSLPNRSHTFVAAVTIVVDRLARVLDQEWNQPERGDTVDAKCFQQQALGSPPEQQRRDSFELILVRPYYSL